MKAPINGSNPMAGGAPQERSKGHFTHKAEGP